MGFRPLINHYWCDTCDFKVMATGSGGQYIVAPSGERCYLRSLWPKNVFEALGRNPKTLREGAEIIKELRESGLLKVDIPMICWKCQNKSLFPPGCDGLICPVCESTNFTDIHLLYDEPCPVCELGTICLDQDW